jgi:hypothetical protein
MAECQVAHTCNPSYLGGRDQEDHSSMAAYLENIQHKTGMAEWLK